ncbi:sigma-70 family RNA polymerase sigma factor [Gemmiger sp.]|uniref:sigma-70 family RNA polymerase sigma factor n=1 Tax=Gemmiger sp. TaxID=2049027 RepID=UPI003FD7D36D
MAYNKARAEKEWLEWKNKEETQLRELGVDEDTIQRLHAYDWEMFKADRNYQQRHINIGTFPEIASEAASDQPHSAADFLDNIEDERLYRLLRKTDSQTLQMLFFKSLGYTAKEIEQKIGMAESMVHNRISRLRKKYKKDL